MITNSIIYNKFYNELSDELKSAILSKNYVFFGTKSSLYICEFTNDKINATIFDNSIFDLNSLYNIKTQEFEYAKIINAKLLKKNDLVNYVNSIQNKTSIINEVFSNNMSLKSFELSFEYDYEIINFNKVLYLTANDYDLLFNNVKFLVLFNKNDIISNDNSNKNGNFLYFFYMYNKEMCIDFIKKINEEAMNQVNNSIITNAQEVPNFLNENSESDVENNNQILSVNSNLNTDNISSEVPLKSNTSNFGTFSNFDNFQSNFFTDTPGQNKSTKSYNTTLLLNYFFGIFGVHRFYLGKTGTGIIMLFTCGGCGIWSLIDLIMTMTGNTKDVQGLEVKSDKPFAENWVNILVIILIVLSFIIVVI